MTGAGRILILLLRTSIGAILVVVGALTAVLSATATSVNRLYPDARTRAGYGAAVNGSPATLLFQGRGYDVATQGGILAQQMAILSLTLFPIALAWIGVRFTRSMEDKGYYDVISSGAVGRWAPVTAGMLAALIVSALTGAGCFVGMLAFKYDRGGAARYALLLILALIAATALGTFTGQLFRQAREAINVSMATILVIYLIRAWIDLRGYRAVWTNPASWLAEARPFSTSTAVWPYLAYVGLAVALGTGTFVCAGRRDLGGGVFAAPEGRPSASRLLSNVPALVMRLTAPTAAALTLAGGLTALVFGLFAEQMSSNGNLSVRCSPVRRASWPRRRLELRSVRAVLGASSANPSVGPPI